ncbi:protein phosphatase 2C family, partial [Kipferlia bialata]
VGDSRVILSRGGSAQRLTVDHRAKTHPSERERIVAQGGYITGDRVNGVISVTRALGDHVLKKFLTCEPEMQSVALRESDDFVIIACDGVWDVVEDQDACDTVISVFQRNGSCQTAADALRRQALSLKTTDNVSVVVLKL